MTGQAIAAEVQRIAGHSYRVGQIYGSTRNGNAQLRRFLGLYYYDHCGMVVRYERQNGKGEGIDPMSWVRWAGDGE